MKIASWNLARGLSNADKARHINEGLDRIDADIVFLPEAFDKTGQPVDPNFAENLGYTTLSVGYEDEEPHPSDEQYIVALSRVAVLLDNTRLATRNALSANFELEGEDISVTGVHLDDRREDIRTGMVDAFLTGRNPGVAHALIGDLNAMHGDDLRAKVLSSAIARSRAESLKNKRARSLMRRLTDMASGDVMDLLEQTGMKDADSRHRPTMLMGGLAVVQLDHFMHDERLRVTSFQAKRLKGSDHKAISGYLELA